MVHWSRFIIARTNHLNLTETHMRTLLLGTAFGLLLTGVALAQNPAQGNHPAANPTQAQQSAQTPVNAPMTVEKLKTDLQSAGFSDVKVMAEAFVVQAKTKDGNPVVMTIGPHGFSAFEAVENERGGSSIAPSASPGNGAKK
jgi:hypothetical protein